MSKFKRPLDIVEVTQWHKDGDHPAVIPWIDGVAVDFKKPCWMCGKLERDTHGWLDSGDGKLLVCPGDYIMTRGDICRHEIIKPKYFPGDLTEILDIKTLSIKDILNDWLKLHGFDGLYCPGECACKVGDLFPCDDGVEGIESGTCEPGYLRPADPEYEGEYEFFIGPDKEDLD